ncbi:YadA C-terminal domain-containing protein [Neisseria sicca]|uniref:YadA C-terminal domain-containing protein n=1 Tax=Neisseria sicca TaxID=490 RepID=UPI000667178C|nr:YadA-like family protein [Neisseria sicca]
MKKFNVKALSLAVAAAVVSSAAAAEEVNFAKAVGEKPDQGQAAFFTVFGEGTTYDKGTGKLTFKKDSDALLLKTLELEQTINGFASGSNFITTDANGNKTVREATNEDIEADSLKGVGLAGGLTAVNARMDKLEEETEAALDDQDETIEELKTAITTNGTRIAEVATGVNKLNESVVEMGKDISTKFDEVDSEISKASFELSESIEKVSEDVTAVNTRVDSLAQDAADAKANAKAAEDKVTALSANVDSKIKEAKDASDKAVDAADKAKDAADKAVDAASKIDAVAEKADKASKGVEVLAKSLEAVTEQTALSIAENTQKFDGFKEGDEIVFTDDKGIKSIKTADKADVEADEFQGLGLKKAVKNTQKATAQATLAAIENDQELNGFKEGDQIVVTKEDGSKVIRTAKKEDVEADGFGGKGLKEVVAAHDEALGDLTETVNDNSEALVKTAEVVNAISADVTANKEAIKNKADQTAVESVKTIAVEAKESVQAVQGAVKEAQESAKAAQTSADAANNVASAAKTAAAQAQDAVKANAAQVDANKADIATLQTASNQHAAGIAKNSARIDSLDKNVANLRKETRQGLAAQAALSGLFQPYSVGKFNVTAALGGFKSDTAVAVGAGYRFNENFAAKAGLAVGTSSGGSASYNVGVNYEW